MTSLSLFTFMHWRRKWQPTPVFLPGESRGQGSLVGCHFLLQGMKVKIESEVAQWCLTLSDPMDCSLPGSSIHGIFQARVVEWVAIAFSIHRLIYTNIFLLKELQRPKRIKAKQDPMELPETKHVYPHSFVGRKQPPRPSLGS